MTVRIGFITDIHHGPTSYSTRFCAHGLVKYKDAINFFNRVGVDLVVVNGDLIDHSQSSNSTVATTDLTAVTALLNTLTAPWQPIFGNHDFDQLTHDQVESITGKDLDYRSLDLGGVHVVLLAGCYTSDSDGAIYTPPSGYTPVYVNPAQRTWLAADLAAMSLPTIVFVHPKPFGSDVGIPPINNASALRTIFEAAPRLPIAVFNGHVHENVTSPVNGIPYYSMQAATEGAQPHNAYGIIHINPVTGAFAIEGRVDQTSYGTAVA